MRKVGSILTVTEELKSKVKFYGLIQVPSVRSMVNTEDCGYELRFEWWGHDKYGKHVATLEKNSGKLYIHSSAEPELTFHVVVSAVVDYNVTKVDINSVVGSFDWSSDDYFKLEAICEGFGLVLEPNLQTFSLNGRTYVYFKKQEEIYLATDSWNELGISSSVIPEPQFKEILKSKQYGKKA